MIPEPPILSGGRRREQEAIWARELEEALLAFTPELTYVACSRLLARLRSMRRLLPISSDSSVLVPYRCSIWDVVVTNLRSHEADRPETLHIRDSNRMYIWAERTSERIYAALETYSGSSRDGDFHLTGHLGHIAVFMSALLLPRMRYDHPHRMCM